MRYRKSISTTSTISTRRKLNSKSRQKVEEISLEPGAITSATSKVPPQKDLQNHAHFEKSGDVGDSGDIFRLSRKGYTIYL
jgi:hypothetical protein